jgi:Family of unknown function (DUF5302)
MTKSAKQDTSKAPDKPAGQEPAATESAATESAATEPATTEPAEAAGEAGTGPAAGTPAAGQDVSTDPAGQPAQADLDETKRKFREALERKHQAHAEGQGQGGRDGGKINSAHGPAASRRNFRRKSG